VAPHFSLEIDDQQRGRMEQAARINAKSPVGQAAEFAGDVASKQAAASADLRNAIDQYARPALQRLERHLCTDPES